jgi:cytochrome c biogenesis protein CcmG, thiol:disulfide interchange protein DsbE
VRPRLLGSMQIIALARKRTLLAGLVLLLALTTLGAGCYGRTPDVGGSVPSGFEPSAGQSGPAPRPGYAAPEITLKDLKGNTVKLSSFRGSPVLINFWTTWCPPCRAEMPDIEAVWQANKAAGLVVIGVDVGEDTDTITKYLEKGGFTWTILRDTEGDVFRDLYRGVAFPSSFFIDKDGIIRDVSIGALNQKGFETKLTKILPGQ